MVKNYEKTIAFAVSAEDYERGQNLPRSVSVSDAMRKAYVKLLEKYGV